MSLKRQVSSLKSSPAFRWTVGVGSAVFFDGADALTRGRLLSEDHFQFRGGEPRPPGWYAAPERLSDPTEAELRRAEKVDPDQ